MRYVSGFFPSLTADSNIKNTQKPVDLWFTGFFVAVS